MNSVNRVKANLTQAVSIQAWERRLHNAHPTTVESLALYRIIFASYTLIFGFPQFSWIRKNPDLFFNPPLLSFAIFFDGFPSKTFFQILDCLIGLLFFPLLFGFQTRLVSIILSFLLIVGYSFSWSFGKINHGSHMGIFTLFLLAFTPWGQKYSLDAYRCHSKNTLDEKVITCGAFSLLALFIGFGYFTAGFQKLFGWMDFDLATHGIRAWLYSGYYSLDRKKYLAEFFINMTNPLIWEVMDYSAVIFEITFLFAVFHRKLFKIFLYIAVYFHLINLLMLNISFTGHYIVYAAFLPWSRFGFRNALSRINLSCIAVTGILIFLSMSYLSLFISGIAFSGFISFFKGEQFISELDLALSIFSALIVLICILWSLHRYYHNYFPVDSKGPVSQNLQL